MSRNILMLTFLSFLIFSPNIFASERPFTGKIVYQISFPNANLSAEEQSMLPNLMTLTIGENYLKTKLPTKLGVTEIIFNLVDNTSTALVDNSGNKFAISNNADNNKEKTLAPVISYTDETKIVAGYLCKKAFVTSFNENGTPRPKVVVYYSDKIKNPGIFKLLPELKGLPGIPLEYEIKNGDIPQMLTATKVNEHSVSKETFRIPKEYKVHQKLEIEHNPER